MGWIGELYDNMAEGIGSVCASFTFFLEFFTHCDRSLDGLVNLKLLLFFIPDIFDKVLGS